ncbi:hypothetical protein I302_103934 [Kwoniella bestiolae CBS 10118]|uniref:BTB domain-containing protein n=1 Tax=Kwoniella bestiolae CBS 10118 TaxID=1296100 RepID=A0A1B9G9W3_9TREE|nr:hypothetical protein I302_02640 [Kwoniella bestiolae CBS 10118]OCF27791.1 hypothetical protein I302_02640 [Kwoniella bestiolae CBS 10118]
MLLLPQPGTHSTDRETAIQCDVSSKILDIFLTHISPNHFLLPMTLEETRTLLSLYDKFDCSEHVVKMLKSSLMDSSKTMPWETLIVASDRIDRQLGAEALRSMSRDIFVKGENENGIFHASNLRRSMNRLRIEWRCKIWDLVLDDQTTDATVTRIRASRWKSRRRNWHTSYHPQVTRETVLPFKGDWHEIARRFEEDEW